MKALPKDLRYLLFDLDGTLTDSAEGILRCVQYALEQCGTPEPDAEKLRPFIGPPLLDSFQEFCGMPPGTCCLCGGTVPETVFHCRAAGKCGV